MALSGYKAFWDASKLIIGINAVGFGVTAVTRTHKITGSNYSDTNLIFSDICKCAIFKQIWSESEHLVCCNMSNAREFIPRNIGKRMESVGDCQFAITGIATVYTLYRARTSDKTKKLLTLCVCLWSLRLSSFLFTRVVKAGEDHRLRAFFPDPSKPQQGWFTLPPKGGVPKIASLAMFWSIQGKHLPINT